MRITCPDRLLEQKKLATKWPAGNSSLQWSSFGSQEIILFLANSQNDWPHNILHVFICTHTRDIVEAHCYVVDN